MPGTPNARATVAAGDLIAWTAQLESMLLNAQSLTTRITKGNFQGDWNAMATYTPNADGTEPTGNDGSPTTTNPIVGLNVSANVLQGFSYLVNDFISFMTNVAPPTQDRQSTIETSLS